MSALDKTKEYIVLNYINSPVAISTKDSSYLIPGGSADNPAEFPLTLSELMYINSVSKIFQIGVLFFEPQDEEEVYEALRIRNWRDIMRDSEIDDIILRPTTELLQKIISIQDAMYFERIYGRYVYLKNLGKPISSIVADVFKKRKYEIVHGVINSKIVIKQQDIPASQISAQAEQIAAMQKQIEQLTNIIAQQQSGNTVAEQPVEKPVEEPEVVAPAPTKKTTAKRTTRKAKETAKEE